PVCAQHRQSRKILRGHGDDKQGRGEADDSFERKLRRDKHRPRHQRRQIESAGLPARGDNQPSDERRDRCRIDALPARDHEPRHDDEAGADGRFDKRANRRETEAEQDPASIALAIGPGIAATNRPNGLNRPAATISRPTARKAPTATGKPPAAAPVAARSAAPGVDQAAEIGMRDARLRPMPATPMAIDRAIRPDAASPSLAPTAVSPLMMTAKEEANPTKAVTMPATTG